MRVYLCGSINGCTDAECKDWREWAKRDLNADVLDPMTRDYRGVESLNVAEIVEQDKADIDACDVLLVYYTRPSVGTSMEVLYAWERGKAVYLVTGPNQTQPLSPWLRYHATKVFTWMTDAIAEINGAKP